MRQIIYLDMDGVLTNFVKAMCEVHGKHYLDDVEAGNYSLKDVWGISGSKFWSPAHEIEFWRNLEWDPLAPEFFKSISKACSTEVDLRILTSPGGIPAAAAGKFQWIDKNISYEWVHNTILCPSKDKWRLASRYSILIDDSNSNVDAFNKAGGRAYLYPQKWNSLHWIANREDFLKDMVNSISGWMESKTI